MPPAASTCFSRLAQRWLDCCGSRSVSCPSPGPLLCNACTEAVGGHISCPPADLQTHPARVVIPLDSPLDCSPAASRLPGFQPAFHSHLFVSSVSSPPHTPHVCISLLLRASLDIDKLTILRSVYTVLHTLQCPRLPPVPLQQQQSHAIRPAKTRHARILSAPASRALMQGIKLFQYAPALPPAGVGGLQVLLRQRRRQLQRRRGGWELRAGAMLGSLRVHGSYSRQYLAARHKACVPAPATRTHSRAPVLPARHGLCSPPAACK